MGLIFTKRNNYFLLFPLYNNDSPGKVINIAITAAISRLMKSHYIREIRGKKKTRKDIEKLRIFSMACDSREKSSLNLYENDYRAYCGGFVHVRLVKGSTPRD